MLFLIPTGPPRFYLEVATDPPGAIVTVNGEQFAEFPTPTWFNGAWGDTVIFEMDGKEPIEIVLRDDVAGLSQTAEGYRLDVGWGKSFEIKTSAEAADYFRESLPQAWKLNAVLEYGNADPSKPGRYAVNVGNDLNFKVESARDGSLAVIHLGSDDVLTLIYPNPFGFTPKTVSGSPIVVGPEIGLIAQEPVGKEWFVFVSAAEIAVPPEIPGVQPVSNWASLYRIDGQGSPGESLAMWLVGALDAASSTSMIVEVDVVRAEQAQ
jgi:hypothetical protein